VIAALGLHRSEQPPVRREVHHAIGITWCPLQVGDDTIGRMVGINREVDDTVELLVGTDSSEGFLLSKGAAGRHQQFGNRHRAPP
jgi:hypothetical protein